MNMEQRSMWLQAKEWQQPPKLEEVKNGFSPQASGGSVALPTPSPGPRETNCGLPASRAGRE